MGTDGVAREGARSPGEALFAAEGILSDQKKIFALRTVSTGEAYAAKGAMESTSKDFFVLT
jgi:hypothetical protein